MAEEAVGCIASAVTAVVADRAVSKLLDNFNRQAAADEKLQRLERLLLMIRSTVEVSEKHDIESATLLQWQEKLREAVSHGDEVLLSFQQRATDEAAAAHQNGNDQQAAGGSSTTTPGTSTAALSFTRNALSSMARRIRGAATALFASDEDMRKLGGAVEALEKASENIDRFIGLLHLEDSSKLKRRRTDGMISASKLVVESDARKLGGAVEALEKASENTCDFVGLQHLESSPKKKSRISEISRHSFKRSTSKLAVESISVRIDDVSLPKTADYRELQELVKRLQGALLGISRSVAIVEIRDIKELERLSNWADVLRDARQQGSNVLDAVRAMARMETVECDFETDQLRSFVLTMENLAGDARYFDRLAWFAPVRKTWRSQPPFISVVEVVHRPHQPDERY